MVQNTQIYEVNNDSYGYHFHHIRISICPSIKFYLIPHPHRLRTHLPLHPKSQGIKTPCEYTEQGTYAPQSQTTSPPITCVSYSIQIEAKSRGISVAEEP